MSTTSIVVPALAAPFNRQLVNATSESIETLGFKLLHKRNRIRLSSVIDEAEHLPPRLSWFTCGNSNGWFAAVARNGQSYAVHLSPLSTLYQTFGSEEEPEDGIHSFTPQVSLDLTPQTPTCLSFALKDNILVIGTNDGGILIFNTSSLPKHPALLKSFGGQDVKLIVPNPGESPETVAILRGAFSTACVEILNVRQLAVTTTWTASASSEAYPTSIAWSAKGKQLALGLSTGDIVTYSPSDPSQPKTRYPKPNSASNSALTSISWLTNTMFYSMFSTTGAAENDYIVSNYDTNSLSAVDVHLEDPCPPFGAMWRPPAPQTQILRDWNPFKHLILVADGPASSVGVIGSMTNPENPAETKWMNINLEENSTPNIPLDGDFNETAVMGICIDLSVAQSQQAQSNDMEAAPPVAPVLFAYTSDGTITGWRAFNEQTRDYPGMQAGISSSAAAPLTAAFPPSISNQPEQRTEGEVLQRRLSSPLQSDDGSMDGADIGGLSFGAEAAEAREQKPSSMFGQTTSAAFGAFSSSIRPASGFGAFGLSSPSSSPGAAAFGTTNATPKPSIGFGSSGFASQMKASSSAASPSGFGASGFGVSAKPASGFGATGFGSTAKSSPGFGSTGFGSIGTPSAPGSSNTFSKAASGGAAGFGAFANNTTTFGQIAPARATQEKPPPAVDIFKADKSAAAESVANVFKPISNQTGFNNIERKEANVSVPETIIPSPLSSSTAESAEKAKALASRPSDIKKSGFAGFSSRPTAKSSSGSFTSQKPPEEKEPKPAQSVFGSTPTQAATVSNSQDARNDPRPSGVEQTSTKASDHASPKVSPESSFEKISTLDASFTSLMNDPASMSSNEQPKPELTRTDSKVTPAKDEAPNTPPSEGSLTDDDIPPPPDDESSVSPDNDDDDSLDDDRDVPYPPHPESLPPKVPKTTTIKSPFSKPEESQPSTPVASPQLFGSNASKNTTSGPAPNVATKPGTPPATPPTPFGLGMGRGNTRPARSSPLANQGSISTVNTGQLDSTSSKPPHEAFRPQTFSQQTSQPQSPFGLPKINPHQPAGGMSAPATSFSSTSSPFSPPGARPSFGASPSPVTPSSSGPNKPSFLSGFPSGHAPAAVKPTPRSSESLSPMDQVKFQILESVYTDQSKLNSKLVDVSNRQAAARHGESTEVRLSAAMASVRDEVEGLVSGFSEQDDSLEELKEALFKQEIQSQHIKRLILALQNPEFKELADRRPLDPEQSEKQELLRRQLKSCETVLQQVESQFASVKQSIESQKRGKISLKTPSLASIDHTCTMLAVAIVNQTKRVEKLSSRLKSKPLAPVATTSTTSTPASRVTSLSIGKNVASALNSESNGQHLKSVLLATMNEPLLTTKVLKANEVDAESTMPSFRLLGAPTPTLTATVTASSDNANIPWTLPPITVSSDDSPQSTPRFGRQSNAKKSLQHQRSVAATPEKIDISPKAVVHSPPQGFSWGAVPVKAPANPLGFSSFTTPPRQKASS